MKKYLDYLALGAVRVLAFLIEKLPKSIGLLIARCCVGACLLTVPRFSRIAARNMKLIFPLKSDAERAAILKGSNRVLAQTLYDFAQIGAMDREWVEAHCDGSELQSVLKKIRERDGQTGVLIGAIHFGSFEYLFQAYAFVDRPISVLARGFGLPKLDEWWTARRELHGHRVFPRLGGHREIVSRLKQGEDVAILFDQNVKRKYATFVNFFGIPAATTKAMGLAALQTGCPIVFVACAETSPGKYKFYAEEIENPRDEPGTFRDKVNLVVDRLHRPLERVIRDHPEQWFWIHRRFRTRPLGQPDTDYRHG